MKKEDFDEMKAFCNEKGFELLNVDHEDNEKFYVIAVKKDPWKGVEFAVCADVNFLIKKIVKTDDKYGEPTLHFSNGDDFIRSHCKPSTESAYIEQLKKEAFERFGEIKDGDRFDSADGYRVGIEFNGYANDIQYSKEIDTLFIGGLRLYQQGKWATKLPERVEVKLTGHPTWTNNKSDGYDFCFHFKTINGGENLETHKAGQFLASCLEKYLNGEMK